METQQAAEISGRLAQEMQATDETRWMTWQALQQFPSEPSEVWLPEGAHTAHWLSESVLATMTVENGTAQIKARPVEAGAWSLAVGYQSESLGGPMAHPGLRSSWLFKLPGTEEFEVSGEIIFRGDNPGEIDAGEKLARAVALRMMQGRQGA
jgi:hypothetical protein